MKEKVVIADKEYQLKEVRPAVVLPGINKDGYPRVLSAQAIFTRGDLKIEIPVNSPLLKDNSEKKTRV